MKNNQTALGADSQNGNPFICQMMPFVGIHNPLVYPFISKKIPFVRLDANGFTLVELIVAMTIVAILSALAAPALTTLIANQRLSGQANELLSDLAFARSEAVRRAGGTTPSTGVTVCKTTDPNAANPSCNATTADAWTAGRIVFVDFNGDGVRDAGDQVLRIRQELEGVASGGNRLLGDGNAAGTAKRITYTSTGATNLALGAEYQMTFCDKRGDSQGLAVAIHPLGRARAVERGKNMDGTAITVCP